MITIYNPHVDDFLAEPPHFRLLRRKALKKYGFVIEQMLHLSGKLCVVIDGTISAFVPDRYFAMLPKFFRRGIAQAEFAWWKRINGLEGRVERVEPVDGEHRGEALLVFSYKGATGRLFSERSAIFSVFPVVVVHLSHYFISTAEKSANLSKLKNVWLAGDSDISANPYFKQFFSWYRKPFLVLPFAVAPRFEVRKPFAEREARCIATGSFHNLDEEVPRSYYADFQSFFKINTYHPVRKLIHEQANKADSVIVSRVSPYRVKIRDGLFKKWLKHFCVDQKDYFSIDIVDLYNCYKFAVVGEEASGFPALGAFEAMACSCVLIAQPRFYTGLGLVQGEHFVVHDGTFESITAAIEMLNTDTERAVAIANAGAAFVNRNFRPEQAFSHFVECVERCRLVGR